MGFDVRENKISHVQQVSLPPFSPCTDFHAGQSGENPGEHQLGNVRAISVAATRPYNQEKLSKLVRNVIEKIDSKNGYTVIGMDIQGDTAGVKISHNKIHLQGGSKASKRNPDSISGDEDEASSDRYIGLRIRSHVDGHTVEIDDNNSISDTIVNLAPERRLRTAMFHGSPHGELEWNNGGCPFARKQGVVAK